ncbi:MAG: hypothetical protein QF615_07385 [Planctomycetota bacterium]|jgi:hypothetical protein|nr:hypothetical protein [Planctomycetota bacterium]MDP6369412.1 hypothetical protein [Planctomycetota bacterium]
MTTSINDAPHGITLVLDTTDGKIVIGRFDCSDGREALLHDCATFEPGSGQSPEEWVIETATYGVDAQHRDYRVPVDSVRRWRKLCEVTTAS